jgi:hypothetical protein
MFDVAVRSASTWRTWAARWTGKAAREIGRCSCRWRAATSSCTSRSHHDDGTPVGAALVETQGVDALHAELRERGYPFLNPGVSPVGAVVARCS